MRNSHRHPGTFLVFSCKTEYFKNSFFPHAINEWNKFNPKIRCSSNYHVFRNVLLKFLSPAIYKSLQVPKFILPIQNKNVNKTEIRFQTAQCKFRHGFKGATNPLCCFSIEAETTAHYFLRCHFYNSNRATIMNDLENVSISFSTVSDNNLVSLHLYGDNKFDDTNN